MICCLIFDKKNVQMKRLFFTLVLMFSVLSIMAVDITPVSEALKAGNADMLNDRMSTEVDVVVPGTSKKGTGNDAVAILKSFFQTNKPTGFTVSHNADKKDSGFFVGKLTTDKGDFRVNITYVVKDDNIFIQVIRIE